MINLKLGMLCTSVQVWGFPLAFQIFTALPFRAAGGGTLGKMSHHVASLLAPRVPVALPPTASTCLHNWIGFSPGFDVYSKAMNQEPIDWRYYYHICLTYLLGLCRGTFP